MIVLNLQEKKLYSQIREEKIITKVAESFYIFLTPDDVQKYVEIIEKTTKEKNMIQSSSSDYFESF